MNLSQKNDAGGSIIMPAESVQPGTQNVQGEPRNSDRAARNAIRELPNKQRANWWIIDLGRMDYDEAWKLQTAIVGARNRRSLSADTILVLEHSAVFTLGRRGGAENLLVSEAFLEKSGIKVTQVERGGNITYHGPGQLVVYPIIDLEAAKISVVGFVDALEEVMLQTAEVWGIKAKRDPTNHGIWVGNQKLGSIGIAIRRGVSFHGLALNVNLDLTPFTWIQPCGLPGVQMTSMAKELSADVPMPEVRKVIKNRFETVFNVQLIDKNRSELMNMLKTSSV
jgi:lipoate-protein ligase B